MYCVWYSYTHITHTYTILRMECMSTYLRYLVLTYLCMYESKRVVRDSTVSQPISWLATGVLCMVAREWLWDRGHFNVVLHNLAVLSFTKYLRTVNVTHTFPWLFSTEFHCTHIIDKRVFEQWSLRKRHWSLLPKTVIEARLKTEAFTM